MNQKLTIFAGKHKHVTTRSQQKGLTLGGAYPHNFRHNKFTKQTSAFQ